MAKNKRVNPRRRPVTMATVNKMREDVKEEAVSLAIAIFLTVLCDKFGYDAEKLHSVWDEVNSLSDSVVKGYVSVPDLKSVLLEEYGINIT